MENDINIISEQKTSKKYIAARVILVIAVSAIWSFISLVLYQLISDPFFTTDFYSTVLHLINAWMPLMVTFVLTLVVSLIQSFIGKKIGSGFPEMLIPCAVALVVSVVFTAIDKAMFGMIATSVLIAAFRFMFLIVYKKGKTYPLCVACALALFVLTPVIFSLQDDFLKMNSGEPDKTGSWGAINQSVFRGADWEHIVTDSPFKLGNDDLGTYPALDGSTVCVPMAMEFARQHLSMSDEEAKYFVYFNTTHYAYESLIYQEESVYDGKDALCAPNLILVTEPSDEELNMAKKAGVELIKKPICYDAFVFITHKDNPVNSLTVQQIRDIYSGKIKNWKDVGGNDEKIKAYQREENSGSQTAMENLVMGGVGMIDPITVPVIIGMGALVDMVAEYDNKTSSIGYTYKYYIDTLYKNDNIKTIAIEGVEPTNDNIRSGAYPFSTNYYGVIRKGDEENTGGKFLDWILSEEGQRCVKQAGYITMTEIE